MQFCPILTINFKKEQVSLLTYAARGDGPSQLKEMFKLFDGEKWSKIFVHNHRYPICAEDFKLVLTMLKESGEAKFHQVLNARDKDGNTLLHHVARNGDLVTVLDLIDENRVTITDLLEKKNTQGNSVIDIIRIYAGGTAPEKLEEVEKALVRAETRFEEKTRKIDEKHKGIATNTSPSPVVTEALASSLQQPSKRNFRS